MLPKGWKEVRIGDLIAGLESGVSVNSDDCPVSDGEAGVLKVSAVSTGRFVAVENKRIVSSELNRVSITPKRGRIIISRSNTPFLVGDSAYIHSDYPNLYLSDKLWQIVPKPDSSVSSLWLAQVLQSPPVRRQLARLATGSSSSMKNISQPTLLGMGVVAPPIAEQLTIAEILDSWDRAIELLENLVTKKAERLAALRHRLLSGTRRFTEYKKARRRTVCLDEVAENISERNAGQFTDERLYAVTKAKGIVPMRDRVKGLNHKRCKIVAKDWFAYNPMRLNIGSISRWQQKQPVMVSGDYVVFRCKEAELLPDYLDHVRRSDRWNSFVRAAGNGSVRVRIYFDDLGRFSFSLPSIEEQRRIAAVLDACEREITLLEAELNALKEQKRGLMEKLLTGKVRVKP